jgi:hypothetical protein
LTILAATDSLSNQIGYGNAAVTDVADSSGGKHRGSVRVEAAPTAGYVFVKWAALRDLLIPQAR